MSSLKQDMRWNLQRNTKENRKTFSKLIMCQGPQRAPQVFTLCFLHIYKVSTLHNHKGFVYVIPGSSGFPYFLQLESEFGNKEFMI